MKKLLTLPTLVLLVFSTICYGQNHLRIYTGPSVPAATFGKSNLTNYYSTQIGGAGTGIAAGASFLLKLNKGFHLSIGADLLYHGLKSNIKKDVKENYSRYDIKNYRQYYNIPVTAGLNYTLPSQGKNTFYAAASAGLNFLNVTGFTGYGFYDDAVETINSSNNFAFKVEYGIILNKNYTIGLTFYNLGQQTIYGYWDTSFEGEELVTKFKGDIKVRALSLNFGLKF